MEDKKKMHILDVASRVLEKKKKASTDMNELAKEKAKVFKIKKDVLIRLKDYQHYKGAGWKDEDPLKKDPEEPCRFPDRVSPIFMKLLDLYEDLSATGRLEELEPYLTSLKLKGLIITSTIPVAARSEELDEVIDDLDSYQGTICHLANEIRDHIKPQAEEDKVVPKKDFDEVLELYYNKTLGADINSKASKMLVATVMTKEVLETLETDVVGDVSQVDEED